MVVVKGAIRANVDLLTLWYDGQTDKRYESQGER